MTCMFSSMGTLNIKHDWFMSSACFSCFFFEDCSLCWLEPFRELACPGMTGRGLTSPFRSVNTHSFLKFQNSKRDFFLTDKWNGRGEFSQIKMFNHSHKKNLTTRTLIIKIWVICLYISYYYALSSGSMYDLKVKTFWFKRILHFFYF